KLLSIARLRIFASTAMMRGRGAGAAPMIASPVSGDAPGSAAFRICSPTKNSSLSRYDNELPTNTTSRAGSEKYRSNTTTCCWSVVSGGNCGKFGNNRGVAQQNVRRTAHVAPNLANQIGAPVLPIVFPRIGNKYFPRIGNK